MKTYEYEVEVKGTFRYVTTIFSTNSKDAKESAGLELDDLTAHTGAFDVVEINILSQKEEGEEDDI